MFDAKQTGNIRLEDVENMAVKYLCGEEALGGKEEKSGTVKEEKGKETPK